MRSTYLYICAILSISLILLSVPEANATSRKPAKFNNLKSTFSNLSKSAKSASKHLKPSSNSSKRPTTFEGDNNKVFQNLVEETARYAINFIPAEGNSSSPGTMAATAVVDMMNQIRDPFKHGVTAAVLAGLYIVTLIALIVFATTGTVAFICSFSDCRHFFLGMKSDGGSPRPYPGFGDPFFFRKRDSKYRWEDMQLQPMVQSLHESYDKYGHNLD